MEALPQRSRLPFQSHSTIPPPSRIGWGKSRLVLCNRAKISSKFDFPEPFGPMKTFSGFNSKGGVSALKESRLLMRIDCTVVGIRVAQQRSLADFRSKLSPCGCGVFSRCSS